MLLPPIVVQRIFVTSLFFAAIALFVYLVGPHVRATLSRNAVVTAWLHVVTVPIDGTVAAAQVTPGTIAAADIPAVRIVNDRLYPGPVAEIGRASCRGRV